MDDTPPDPEFSEPFSQSPSSGGGENAPPWEQEGGDPFARGTGDDGMSPSFALKMARLWVQRHQKASMLGAFAVGVFIGAMVRD